MMLYVHFRKIIFFVGIVTGLSITNVCFSLLPTDDMDPAHMLALKEEWKHRKNLDAVDSKRLAAHDELCKKVVTGLNVNAFYQADLDAFSTWMAEQSDTDEQLTELKALFNTLCLPDQFRFTMNHQVLRDKVITFVSLPDEERAALKEEILQIEGCPQGIFDDFFLECVVSFIPLLMAQDHAGIERFFAQIMDVCQQARDPFIKKLATIKSTSLPFSLERIQVYYGVEDGLRDYHIMQPIMEAMGPSLEALKKETTSLMADFFSQAQKLDAQENCTEEDKNKIAAYGFLHKKLQEQDKAFANFYEITKNVEGASGGSFKRSMQLLYYASEAYDLLSDFFSLYKKDCQNKDFKDTSSKFFDDAWCQHLMVPYFLKTAFFAANNVAHYRLMRSKMSAELAAPYLQFNGGTLQDRKKAFLDYFGGKHPVLGGSFVMPTAKAVNINAAFEVAKSSASVAMKDAASSSQKLNSIGQMAGGSSYTTVLARKLIISALYYNTVHRKFVPTNAALNRRQLAAYTPWVDGIVDTINWAGTTAAYKVESVLYRTLSVNILDSLEKWTIGVVTPDLVSKLFSIGIDGLLSSKQAQERLRNVACFDKSSYKKIGYGKTFDEKFAGLSDKQRFAYYADRELFSYGIGAMAKYLGGNLVKSKATVVMGALKTVTSWFVGKETVSQYEQGLQGFKMIVSQGLAVMLAGPDSEAEKDFAELLEGLHKKNPELAALASVFSEFAAQGRSGLMMMFGMREIPGKRDEINRALLIHLIYEVLVHNPLHVRIITGKEIAEIITAFDNDPSDMDTVASMIVDVVEKNALGKLGGALCGSIGEWQARRYWDKRGKPFVFGR